MKPMKTKIVYKVLRRKAKFGKSYEIFLKTFNTLTEAEAYASGYKKFRQHENVEVRPVEVMEKPEELGFFDIAVEVNNVNIDIELFDKGLLPNDVLKHRLIQLREIIRVGYVHEVEEVHEKLKLKLENEKDDEK